MNSNKRLPQLLLDKSSVAPALPSETDTVSATLETIEVHNIWEAFYRAEDNNAFYELAMDRIVDYLKPAPDSVILDAGCGNCTQTLRLVKRGLRCYSVDFSPSIIAEARATVRKHGLRERVEIHREDLTKLSLPDSSFEYIFCWGVLMHIPAMEKAVAELCRVLKPGGKLVIQEDNMYSIQGLLPYLIRRIKGNNSVVRTPAGLEYWIDSPAGPVLARKADIGFLKRLLEQQGVAVKKRFAGQFTEAYTHLDRPLARKLVHFWNNGWFRYIRLPQLAFGNILIGEKRGIDA